MTVQEQGEKNITLQATLSNTSGVGGRVTILENLFSSKKPS